MQENSKLNFLTNLLKEHLEPRITRLETRNLNEQKDLKLVSTELDKLKAILKDSEKIAENVFSKKASKEQSEILNKSVKRHLDDKNKKTSGNETSRKPKPLTRNATEANIIDSHREKKLDPKDRLTPFKKKLINGEETKNLGNRTSRIEEKAAPKTPKGKKSLLESFIKIPKEDKNDGNTTERLKVPSTAKALTRNKTTANFLTSRKPKEDEEKPKDSDKTVNQSMRKSKKDLQTIPETKTLTKQPTARKIETARKEKPELTKHATEAVIKPNAKLALNKEKDLKAKETSAQNGPSSKVLNGKLKPKTDNKDFKTNPETKNNLDFESIEVLKTEEVAAELENAADEAKNGSLPNGNAAKSAEAPKKEVKRIKYMEKIKEDVLKNHVFEMLDLKGEERNMFKLCKKFYRIFLQKAQSKLDAEINGIKTKIANLKDKYKEEDLQKEAPKFVMTRGAIKAVELLNDKMYMQLFNPDVIPSPEVLNIYRILLFYINKAEIAKIKQPSQFWPEVCKLFAENSEGKIGSFINKYANDLNFSTDNILAISQIIGGDLSKMTAPSYTKICPTTGLVFFFIKDALEYSGIIVDKKTPLIKLMNLLEYSMESLDSKLERLRAKVEKLDNTGNTAGKAAAA